MTDFDTTDDVAFDLLSDKAICERRALTASQRCVRIITVAFIVQVLLSANLWFPYDRSYPEVPLLGGWFSFDYKDWFTAGLTVLMLVGLVMSSITALWRQPALILALVGLVALLLEDVNRFQPWVYIYGMLMVTIAWHRWRDAPETKLAGLQFIMSMVYFWTGIHKLNVQFVHDVYPWLVSVYPFTSWMKDYTWLGYGMGLTEVAIGALLLLVRTRKTGVILGGLLHVGILAILIKDGWNTVVYPWNVAMVALLVALFWFPEKVPTMRLARHRPNAALLALFGIAPAFYLVQWLPLGLSLALYSGTAMECDLIIQKDHIEQCIPKHVHDELLLWGEGERLLSLDDWGMANLNIPPFASNGSYKQVAREFCACAKEHGRVVFYYPNPWRNEDLQVSRSCTQLLRDD